MIIRKLFTFEGAHIVRNCTSHRCSHSIHGHSYTVEVFITGTNLDNGQMIMDFGLMKGNIKDLIDSFDHAYSLWRNETDEFKSFMITNSERWVSMPVSPSAEAYSLMFLYLIDIIIQATEFNNGEQNVEVSSVRVHETKTGYAESFRSDLDWFNYKMEDIIFSDGIKSEWKDSEMYDKLKEWYNSDSEYKEKNKLFINPEIQQLV